MCDCFIVGSGFCGSVIARRLAEEQNKKIIVVERRNHIAGNMYDKLDENGILVQRYGPHIFHTNSQEVYSWITKYGEWEPFCLRCMVDMDGVLVPSPFNFQAIDMMYPDDLAKTVQYELIKYYGNRSKVTIMEMLHCENPFIKAYADMLFEKDYRPYTAKQWGIPPEEIDVSVLQRVPILLSYDDAYFNDTYQIMPKGGFTSFFSILLNHPNIKVCTCTDALAMFELDLKNRRVRIKGHEDGTPVVYTGAVDELMGYMHGRLPYRSLRFEYRTEATDSFQDTPVVAYPKADGYTRITEYKKLPMQKADGVTTIAVEFPLPYNEVNTNKREPFYPIPNEANIALYHRYVQDLKDIEHLYLCGRLADYKYYNMDNAIERAFEVYETIKFLW